MRPSGPPWKLDRIGSNSPRTVLVQSIVLLVATAAASAARARDDVPSDPVFVATRTDGTTVSGRLRAIDLAQGVTLAVDDKGKLATLKTADLVKLSREAAAPSPGGDGGMVVLFPDGDRLLRCGIGPAGDAAIEVVPLSLGSTSVPLDAPIGLIFAPPPPSDVDGLHAWMNRVRDEPRTTEIAWLTNGDRLRGSLLGIDDKVVKFSTPGGKVELERGSVVALGFDPKLVNYPRPEGPYVELTFTDGSRLGVAAPRLEGGQVVATTRYGQTIRLAVGDLAQVHVKNGSVVYLSELAPPRAKYIPYVGPTRPMRFDRAVDGQPLRLGGKTYDHGLGTQSKTYLAYFLEPGTRRFQATVGIDDRAGPLGSVVFAVVIDGKEKFRTPPMSARDVPRVLDFDVTGAKTLVLITDFGERGEVRDHADWVEARFLR